MEAIDWEKKDVWTRMKECGKPIVFYGMGNGADKILAVMEQKGMQPDDFFASDGFVRGHSFHGKRVLSYSEAREKYRDMLVVIAFASARDEVLARFREIDAQYETVAPDVPVAGDTLFCSAYFRAHRAEAEAVYALLEDDESRMIYENVLLYKLTGKLCYLFRAQSDKDAVMQTLIRPHELKSYLDLGAYNGDTIRALLEAAPNVRTVYAMEPDVRNFKKLSAYTQTEARADLKLYPYAAWNCRETLSFSVEGNRNSKISMQSELCNSAVQAKVKTIDGERPDAILGGLPVDYIKYDVEGAELQALDGTINTIQRYAPKLLVSLYHRTEDLFSIPLYLKKLQPAYRFYLRRFPYVPAWDINLYCIPRKLDTDENIKCF